MPLFDVEYEDGRKVRLEADHQPTEQEVHDFLSAQQPQAPKPATTLGELPGILKEDILRGAPKSFEESVQIGAGLPQAEAGKSVLPALNEFSGLIQQLPPAKTALGRAGESLLKSSVGMATGATSPEMVPGVLDGGLATKALFSAMMIKSGLRLPGRIKEILNRPGPLTDQDKQDFSDAFHESVGSLYLGARLGVEGALEEAARFKLLPKATEAAASVITEPRKETYAPEERKVQESVQPERAGNGPLGTPDQTSGGGGVQPATGVEKEAQVPLKPATTEATARESGKQPDTGLAASVRNKWTLATSGESAFVTLDPLKQLIDKATPYVRSAIGAVKEIAKEQANISKLDDYRKSVLGWSGKLQRSFQEANNAQKEIQSKVPDPLRREAITNWIQANGDPAVLRQRAASSKPEFRKGYEAALSLTPEELTVANDVKQAYDTLGQRGLAHDVLKSFKDNYVTQIWDLGKGPQFAGSRTLRDKFRFSKASTFPTFFDGEQAGFTPKTKDISKLLPVYLHEMNSVIAARQLVKDLSAGVASDGRPLVVPRGTGRQVTDTEGKSAILITPKSVKGQDTSDYRVLPNQPALHDWTWATKDEAGNPVFLKSDLALHPEAYGKLRNVLGKSAIREWYSTRTSAVAQIPKALVRGLDEFNSVTKRTMLGFLSPFHQVQEATHALGHRVNPTFNIPEVDLVNNRSQMDAANHGLMLQPDRTSAEQFMEGFRMSGLVSRIPVLGPLADFYSDYLFHQYIPGLKFKTYEAIQSRNMQVYDSQLKSGEVTESDVKHLSAEQANAAFGHLNYADLARNPTVQHVMRLGFLAPDFFEARGRFTLQAAKGAAGTKVGREQAVALATLALGQMALAYTSAKLTGGEWDRKHPFEFHVGNRRFALRSVPEDIQNLLVNTRTFIHSRLSPIIGKGILQYLSGVDWRGQKVSAGETTKELLQQPVPIGLRGFLGLGRQSLSGWEQLASAVGLRISRYSPSSDVFDMAHQWMASSPDPKVQSRLRAQQHSVFPESDYRGLRLALADNNLDSARQAYAELLKTKTPEQVRRAMSHKAPFTGASASEKQFVKSLTPEQKKIYQEAVKERAIVLKRFQSIAKHPSGY